MDLMLGTHFTVFGIGIGKCKQDSNHLLSKQVFSKILGIIDLCICGGNNFFITPLGFFCVCVWLEKVKIPNYNKCKLLIFTQKIKEAHACVKNVILILTIHVHKYKLKKKKKRILVSRSVSTFHATLCFRFFSMVSSSLSVSKRIFSAASSLFQSLNFFSSKPTTRT